MDDKEAAALFTGYVRRICSRPWLGHEIYIDPFPQGYQIAIVEYDDVTNTSPEADRKVQIDFHAALLWYV